MKSEPNYRWYYRRWLLSPTRARLSLKARSIYRDLLDQMAELGGSLPSDKGELAGLALCSRKELDAAWPHIEECFERREDGRLSHKVLEPLVTKSTNTTEARRVAGKAGAAKRWQKTDMAKIANGYQLPYGKNGKRIPIAIGLPFLPSPSPLSPHTPQSPTSPINTPPPPSPGGDSLFAELPDPKPAKSELDSAVSTLCERHPRGECARTTPAEVRRQLEKILRRHKRKGLLAEILKNHKLHCDSWEWQKENHRFAKKLANWLAPTENRYLEPPPTDSKQDYAAPSYDGTNPYAIYEPLKPPVEEVLDD